MASRPGPIHGRYRYGPWHGGPDPLAPPYDVRAALDEVGREVLAGTGAREALRDLLRRGIDGRGGLDELAERIRRMRDAARRRGDLGGTLDQVRAMLDQALAAERDALAAEDTDAARLAEMDLATLPDDVAGAVRALADHDWHSPEARAAYEAIAAMLRREVLDAQFAGLKQALSGQDPEAMNQVKDMLADLNALLAAHARGETRIRGAEELRVKESDRIEAVADALRACGARIKTHEDGWTITGVPARLRGGRVDARGDHRIAMLGAVAGLASKEGVEVEDAEVAAISFPGFYELLDTVIQR